VSHHHHDPAARVTRVGINICESAYWGQGLGTEALHLWVGYLFEGLDLRSVRLGTWSGNDRMVRCARKCRFALVERRAGERDVRGERYDALEFELTREEWLEWGHAEEA
jgi:RimJ/RimL family protein N-acetyltransferase